MICFPKKLNIYINYLKKKKVKTKALNEERLALHQEMENIQDTIQKERDEIMEKISRLEMIEHQQQKLETVFEEQKQLKSSESSDIQDIQNAYEEELGKARITIRNLSVVIEQNEKNREITITSVKYTEK